jgi:4-diphosphocytidyl-2-C-methyl-D-erythritol kinase
LGSDCTFFIDNIPSKASGRGELLEPVEVNLNGLHIVLETPDIHVSTKEAYSNIVPQIPDISVSEIMKLSIDKWKNLLQNDFEKSIFPLYPEIARIKEKMYEQGAIYSSMSGSGATVFGLFSDLVDK